MDPGAVFHLNNPIKCPPLAAMGWEVYGGELVLGDRNVLHGFLCIKVQT